MLRRLVRWIEAASLWKHSAPAGRPDQKPHRQDPNPVEPTQRKAVTITSLQEAIANRDEHGFEDLLNALHESDPKHQVEVLNLILLNRDHKHHQQIVRQIQDLADPSSVPYLRRTLEDGIDYMDEYNGCSGTGVVAKWLSHALFSIGTAEAIEVLRDFAKHPDPEIRDEMLYRLGKLSGNAEADVTASASGTD